MTNKVCVRLIVAVLVINLATGCLVQGQQKQPQKADDHMTQESMKEMNERGDKAMGFDHVRTTHHFLLARDGGIIQVETKHGHDQESREQIRRHLRHIAMLFAEGDFDTPMFIHAKTAAGIDVMQRLKTDINYKFEETKRGARVVIASGNVEAIQGIHDFLIFQIKEHKTGDSLKVGN